VVKTTGIGIADFQEIITPTEADTELARESSRQLSSFLGKHPVGSHLHTCRLRGQADNEPEEVVVIPICSAPNGLMKFMMNGFGMF
jgi:hypothetical protein